MNAVARRSFLALAASGAVVTSVPRVGRAHDPPPVFPLSIGVAEDPEPVVSACWLDRQVREAERLLAIHGIHVTWARRHALPATTAALEDADARDALAAHVEADVVNVFVVRSLRDVDDPTRLRMGVRWRLRRDLRRDYVIVAASAVSSVLAHELGHYFGNGHSTVVDNVMSYDRRDPARLAFDARQGRIMRQTAQRLVGSHKVRPWPVDGPTIEPEGCRSPGDYRP